MGITEKKYQLGTAENQEFLKRIREGLLSFGHQFPVTRRELLLSGR